MTRKDKLRIEPRDVFYLLVALFLSLLVITFSVCQEVQINHLRKQVNEYRNEVDALKGSLNLE
jgi:hypothetical protein